MTSKSSENGRERRLACVVSQANGEDLGGTGTPFGGYLLVEVAPPWKYDVGESRRFPEDLWEAVKGGWNAGVIEKFTTIMPDREYSRKGHSRAILLRRPADRFFASYQKEEYLVPEGELVPLVEALSEPEGSSRFARYGEDTSQVRDVLVCTHGSHDVCCGRFGYPLYEELRQRYAAESEGKLRVWRTSHLGGHRFAPNLIDLPEGRYWGRMRLEDLENFVIRNGSASDLREFHRGWAGLGGRSEQVAEGEAFSREGWGWAEYPKAGEVIEVDEDGESAEVRIEYRTPDGAWGAYEATVKATGNVTTLLNSGTEALQEARQYSVSRLERVNRS